MRFLTALILAFVVFIMWAVVNGTKVETTCGPSVSTPPVVVGLDGAGKLGDSLRDLIHDGPTPLEVYVFVRRVMNLSVLLGDVFGAHLRGESEPLPAEGLRKAAGQAQADALAGCCVQNNPTGNPGAPSQPPNVQPWDPKNDIISGGLGAGASPEQVARDAARRYFPPSQIDTAVAVAGAESSFRPGAVLNYHGEHMLGLWQINDGAHANLVRGRNWRDPVVNAAMAYQVWKDAGGSWRPWSTFNSGSYKRFLHSGPTDRISAPQQAQPVKPACTPASSSSSNTAMLSDPSFAQIHNGQGVEQAVAYMEGMAAHRIQIPSGRCLHYVGAAYGWQTTTSTSAFGEWRIIPAAYRHPGDRNPARGALLFWGPTPANAYGHVALSLGGGRVASTDWPVSGRIGVGLFKDLVTWPRGEYLGSSAPWFPGQSQRSN